MHVFTSVTFSSSPQRRPVTPELGAGNAGSSATGGLAPRSDWVIPDTTLALAIAVTVELTSSDTLPATRPKRDFSAGSSRTFTRPARARVLPSTTDCARTHSMSLALAS